MIDKSVPYFPIIMCLPNGTPLPEVPLLPEGYSYKLYTHGNEVDWCAVEVSVHEFDNAEKARECFQETFMAHEPELFRRMVFIVDPDGRIVANATAWWGCDERLGSIARLHWVAVMPDVQGKGFGRAVVAKALSLFSEVGPKGDIWLTTQTFSHVAVDLYVSLGFRIHRSATPSGDKNGYQGAMNVLQSAMRPTVYQRLLSTALE